MTHKLAHRWTAYSFDLDKKPPMRIEDGVMDLTNMSEDGKLDDGSYEEIDTGATYPISGKAKDSGEFMHLSLKNQQRPERWSGVLVFDQGNEMKVAGLKFVTKQESQVTERFLDQEEEPWLITKP